MLTKILNYIYFKMERVLTLAKIDASKTNGKLGKCFYFLENAN
jgi:hypothetical protein